MNELDFSDKPVSHLPTRIAPAVTCSQGKRHKKHSIYQPTRLRDIENRMAEIKLANELREIYDW